MQNIVNSNISWYEGHTITSLDKILCTKYMESSEGMTSSTRSFAYSYRLVKKCFLKICETSKCHNFLIFQPIFIRFSLFCSENFTLSSEIKLEQFPFKALVASWTPFFETHIIESIIHLCDFCHYTTKIRYKIVSFYFRGRNALCCKLTHLVAILDAMMDFRLSDCQMII